MWGYIESWPLVEEDKWGRPDNLKAWTDRNPYLEKRSTHLKQRNMYVANDWDTLIQQLHHHLGPNRKVAFFHDASIHILEAQE